MENNLKIRIKGTVNVGGRKTRIIKFRLNPIQMQFAQYVAFCWDRGLPIKALEPKPRQIGSTTYWQALGFTLCVLDPGWHVLTVAHTEGAGTEIFGKTRTFLRHLPQEWKLELTSEKRNSIEWANGSKSWIGSSSEGDAFGKGPTPSMLHFTEPASYGDRGQDPYAPVVSAHGALDDNPKQSETIVVYESTAKGRDPIFWEECELARNPRSGSEYTLLFVPWFHDPHYSMPWKEYRRRFTLLGKEDPGATFVLTEDERILREKIAVVVVKPIELTWRHRFDISDAQLIWRRWAIQNTCKGKIHLFERYYPATYEEAFSASIRCMFDQDTLNHYYQGAFEPKAVGNLESTGPEVVLKHTAEGRVKIWKYPQSGEEYVLGADVGGGEKLSDPCAAYVLNSHTLEVVAALHANMDWDDYTQELVSLGRFYNWAELVVENNYNPAVATTLFKDFGYPNLYHYTFEGQLKGTPNKAGFNTNRRTRPELISYLDSATRGRKLQCYDIGFAREMEQFVYVQKEDRYRATGKNHDDRIMAVALAIYRCEGKEGARVKPDDLSPDMQRSQELADFVKRMSGAERQETLNLITYL